MQAKYRKYTAAKKPAAKVKKPIGRPRLEKPRITRTVSVEQDLLMQLKEKFEARSSSKIVEFAMYEMLKRA